MDICQSREIMVKRYDDCRPTNFSGLDMRNPTHSPNLVPRSAFVGSAGISPPPLYSCAQEGCSPTRALVFFHWQTRESNVGTARRHQ